MAAGPGYREKVSNITGRISSLYSQSLAIMSREVKHLADMSREGKLPSGPAKDLRDYVKLLGEMKEQHDNLEAEKAAKAKASGKGLSEEELLKAVTGAAPLAPLTASAPMVVPTPTTSKKMGP